MDGPDFHFRSAPSLFLERQGSGPLRVVWDTNVLLVYLKHGSTFWADELPSTSADREIEAFSALMNAWTAWDIRIQVFDEMLSDPRLLSLDNSVTERMTHAIEQITMAFDLGVDGNGWNEPVPPALWDVVPPTALMTLPQGGRELVGLAQRAGAHVFVTLDEQVLRKSATIAPYGLAIMKPSDLADHLAAYGVFEAMTTGAALWPIPDLQRVSHLISALKPAGEG